MPTVDQNLKGTTGGRHPVPAGEVEGSEPAAGSFRTWFAEHRRDDVYFVLGVQGSGTNLVARVLQSVFEFSAVLDGSLIFDAAVRVERRPRREIVQREFEYVRNRLFPSDLRRRFAWKHHHHRNAGFVEMDRHFDPSLIANGGDFARFFYTYQAWKLGRRHMLVKSDDLWQNIESLGLLFPRRKVIFLVRDPRDNALSISHKNFGPCDLFQAARYTERQLRLYSREAARRPQDAISVKYETLLDEPISFVQEFAARFGFDVPMEAVDMLERLHIRSDNSQKWRRLSSRDLSACDWVFRRHLQDFGYPMSGHVPEPPSLPGRFGRRVNDLLRRVPQKVGRVVRSLTDSTPGVVPR